MFSLFINVKEVKPRTMQMIQCQYLELTTGNRVQSMHAIKKKHVYIDLNKTQSISLHISLPIHTSKKISNLAF